MSEKMSPTGKKVLMAGLALPVLVGAGLAGWKLRDWAADKDADAERKGQGPDAVYDESQLKLIDPVLRTWSQVKEIKTGLKTSEGMAILSGDRVAVVGEHELRVINGEGKVLASVKLDGDARAVASAGGKLYVGVGDHVQIYGEDGTAVATWAAPGMNSVITGIAVGADGQVWAADAGQRVIVQYDAAGKVVGKLGVKDEAKRVPGFVVPSPHLDVAVVGTGAATMIWANNPGRHELEAFATDGTLMRKWGEAGFTVERFAGCCNPTDFAIFTDGRFVTSDKGVPRVRVWSPDGKLLSVVAGVEALGEQVGGLDVAIDGGGRVWLNHARQGVIRVFAEQGAGRPVAAGAVR